MSTYGFPDGQEITQWLGQVLAEQTAAAIGAGAIVLGPFSLANFASVVVALEPTGGPVDVTVTQKIAGGPVNLELQETLHVTAGETVFQAFVLFGDQVTVTLQGSVGGTTVDYAVYPSNTTTNAQVIQSATIDVQHNDALVGTEQALDFEDGSGIVWTLTDDGANKRVKIAAKSTVAVQHNDAAVASEQALDFEDVGSFKWTVADDAANGRVKVSPPAGLLSGCRVTNSTVTPIPNSGAFTLLSFDTEVFDTDGYHNPAVNPSRMTAPVTGLYLVSFNYLYAITGAYGVGIRFRKNGATVVAEYETNAADAAIPLTHTVYLAAGDYVEVLVEQQSATNPLNVVVTADVSPYFSIARLV